MIEISGGPRDAQFRAAPGYPVEPERDPYRAKDGRPAYSSMSVLAVEAHIYQYLSTSSGPYKFVDGHNGNYQIGPAELQGAKLIYSPDNGHTWCNQDGSTPVVRESAGAQSRKTMVFWGEPRSVFSGVTFLQMGKGYRD